MINNYFAKRTRLEENIKDLIRKDLLPKHTQGYFDLKKLDYMLHFTEKQVFKEWTCDICMISVYGPKKLLIEHHKTHSMKKEIKENELYQRKYKLY